MKTSDKCSILWISSILISVTFSTVVMPDSWQDADEYRNPILKSKGYDQVTMLELNHKKFTSDFDKQSSVFLKIYIIKKEGSSIYDRQSPSKMAFEIYPKDAEIKMGKDSHVTSKDKSSEKAEFAVSVSDDILSLIKLPPKLYSLSYIMKTNNCLGLFTFITNKEEAPLISMDSENKLVYLDFEELKNPMFENGYFGYNYTTNNYSTKQEIQKIDSSKDSFVNMFCPFWMNSDSLLLEADMNPVFISSIPYYFGKFN
jgi:hypothetical protein